jgi:hypothetical protein
VTSRESKRRNISSVNGAITLTELGRLMGVTRQRAYQLMKEQGVGTKRAGIWFLTAEEGELLKKNCQTYLLANR